ncbi:MAG TPA: sulfotransferase family 2 domain-containing protein [Bryobacteraceae bacterium]|jgi:hypothetical protein|nr:sulfotransferase family 2 domain-containing protein [Bryobacteraceae bacterium]
MISHKLRCIFVHVPKTGGTSIEDVIWPAERTEEDLWMGFVSAHGNKYQTGGLQHLLARQIRQEVGDEIFGDYFKFAIVRNPWDRSVSQFCYTRIRTDLHELIGMTAETSFSEYLALIEGHEHVQWQPQFDFLYDADGSILVDFVGRFERLEQDARSIFSRLSLETGTLPHANASDRRPYREYFDASCKRRIERLYGQDIEAFGYEF